MTEMNTLQKALISIRKLKTALNEQQTIFQPMAIIGLSCRFPRANNKDEFWQLLCKGENVITKIPEERWQLLAGSKEEDLKDNLHPYWGSYLKEISAFDAYFFGISPREARCMDPQQRLLLEVGYEALEDAGSSLESIAGSNCGVFLGMYTSQLAQLQNFDDDMDALFIPSGNATSIAANRISYHFDLHGPSMVIDTACSSSLVALHEACMNIKNKQCDMALVGGANINLLPYINLVLAKAKMLSPDGQCHTFDKLANGYVPGEGVGFVVIKPLGAALRDNNKIYAVIQGSAVNQDGRTNGLTAPNGLQQEDVLQAAYSAAKINPQEISFIECHGTGTFLGDPIEVQALGNILGKNRASVQPCYLGSVKANIGHLEPAAGIASIIKTALCLEKGMISPQVNFSEPNPHIAFKQYQFEIPTSLIQFPQYGERRLAGVSGFGFGGTNVHLVLSDAPMVASVSSPAELYENGELFTLSAKDISGLKLLINHWCNYLADKLNLNFSQLCYNTHMNRSHYSCRLAIYACNMNELYDRLRNVADNFYIQSPYIFIKQEIPNTAAHLDVQPQVLSPQWQDTFTSLVTEKIIGPVKSSLAELLIEKLGVTNSIKTILSLGRLSIEKTSQIRLFLLGSLYANDVKIDWSIYENNRKYKPLDLPSYPWQRKQYWPSLQKTTAQKSAISVNEHPFNGKQVSSPLMPNQFEFNFDIKVLPEIADTFNVLHAGFYLEMIAFAVDRIHSNKTFIINKLIFLTPLLVSNTANLKVQLVVEKGDKSGYSLVFYSHSQDGNNWVKNATALLSFEVEKSLTLEPVKQIKNRCNLNNDANHFYEKITRMHMPSGNSIRWAKEFWQNMQGEILCEFVAPKSVIANERFKLNRHPGIIDGSIQPIFITLPDDFDKPYVASEIKQLIVYPIAAENLYLYAVLKTIVGNGEQVVGDWYLMNAKGDVYIAANNVTYTQYDNKININTLINSSTLFELDSSLSIDDQKAQVLNFLLEQTSKIFSMPMSDIHPDMPLRDMGIDSLMALVLNRAVEDAFKYSFSIQDIMQGLSLTKIVAMINEKMVPSLSKATNANEINNPTNVKNPWIANCKRISNAKVKLLCFPFGGGGASIYQNWDQYLPDFIEVCPVQLPGREERLNETPINDINTMIHLLIENLQAEIQSPFALLGHSFGALLAFELARYCDKNNLRRPVHLFASAYPDPRTPQISLDNLLLQLKNLNIDLNSLAQANTLDKLTDEEFARFIMVFNQNGLLDYADSRLNRQIMQLIMPTFVADMSLVKSYQYYPANPFNFPLTVFVGKQDQWVLPEDHYGWKDHTTQACEFVEFNAGHLFIKEKVFVEQMCNQIAAALFSH